MKNEAAAPSARLLQGTCSSDAKIKVVEEKVKVVPLVKRLTQPQSPNLTALTRTRSSKGKLSHTSRELLEIKKQKEEIQKERVKTKRYREATQVVISSRKKRKTPNEKENKLGLKMTLRSGGVVGVPAIKHRMPTRPKPFHLATDQPAAAREF